jgi:predicted neuraminidase
LEKIFLFQSPPSKQCHAATIVETPAGLAAAWFGGSREGAADVGIWFARQTGAGWTDPVEVVTGTESARRYPCWNPVLFSDLNGDLLLFYKVGPSPSSWWGCMVTSANGGETWSASRRLPDGILGPVKNKPLPLLDGRLLCPSSREDGGWRVHVEITPDLGETWQVVEIESQYEVIQPAALQHQGERLQLLCRSKSGWVTACWSADNGLSWSQMELTALPNPNSGIDAVSLADKRFLLVYNHTGMLPGRWGGPRTPLNIAISSDGLEWRPGPVLEDEPGEYSYPAVIQASDGRIHIVYTWRRENIRHVVVELSELEG